MTRRERCGAPFAFHMHPSPYLLTFPCPDKPGWQILYSTRKASLLLLPDQLAEKIRQGEELAPEITATLGRLSMLVEDPAAELETGRTLLAAVNSEDPGLNVAVILCLDCNFNCGYCYEGSLKEKRYLDEATAARLVEYVQERFRPGKKKLNVDFYGGEPLLAVPRIKQIAAALQKFAEERGAAFQFSLVTNGSLLTRRTAAELKELGLRSAKVTVDGPADLHDQARPFKSGEGSFATILRNLRESAEIIKIGLQSNYTRDNYRRFPELYDQLLTTGLGPERIGQIACGPVLQISDPFAPAEFSGGCCSINEPWLAEASVWLRKEAIRRGYRVPKITPSPCMVDIEDGFTVHCDGTLYKCMGFIGHTRYAVGDIWQGMAEGYENTYRLDLWQQNPECRDCTYLPLCFGGCRYMEYQRAGEIRSVDCQKEYWDAALEKLLQQTVKHRVTSDQ